jgi:DNA-binding transcriptional LysR family regulator
VGAVFTAFWQPFSVGSLSTYRPWFFCYRWRPVSGCGHAPASQPLGECGSATLMRDELCAILPAGSPLARRRRHSIRGPGSRTLYHIPLSQRATAPNRLRKLQPHSAGSFRGAGSRTLIRLVREGPGFSVVARLGFSTALPGVALVPVTPGIRGELRLALQDQKHAPPALRAFPHSVGASKKQRR